jgi:serine/threonine protein kinase
MRCLLCNRDDINSQTELCPGCGVYLPSLLRDVLPEGTLLHGGKYRIEYALGRGGFGITYLAHHVSLEQAVAVKEFYPQEAVRSGQSAHVTVSTVQKGSYERALQRFVREGRVLAMLNHPNVVRVRDQFEERGTAYLVMDYVSPARTLREELDAHEGKRLPVERVRKIIEQLVEALEAVHAKGVFHLDIKPANVLLTPGGHAILVDFGAARHGLGSSKSTQAYTPEYAAPEVLAAGDVGPQTDLYELGVMLHEMLTGELPPSAIARLTKDRWTTAHLQDPWRGLVAAALRLDREARPPTVRAWWNAQGASLEPTVVV